jgi:ATPase subunit of ABC transporter with duplicated ATPase domains
MITVSSVTKGFAGSNLFEDVNVGFAPGNNYGLTGPNGCGKSTFMKILIGAESSDEGHVSLPERTAWLRQDHTHFDKNRVIDTVIMGNARLWDALSQREALYEKEDLTDDDGEMLGELEMVVMEEDGYTAEPEAAILLAGLGIMENMHDLPMSELQGGLKLRVLLAQALFGKPDALLLDEPTNHLDMESIRWLEEFLIDYRGVLVVISHDRRFLNSVCDNIADIDYQTIILYPGNYNDMVRQKAEYRSRIDKQNANKQKKKEQLQQFIQRFSAGTRASQTRSRAKQVEKLQADVVKRSNIARPFIRFEVNEPTGRNVLEVQEMSWAYADLPIFTDFTTNVQRGEKVAIIGKNGIGKTTLINALLAEVDNPSHPKVRWGHNSSVGYMSQNHHDEIEAGSTVFEWLFNHRPAVGMEQVRSILGRMLFRGDDGGKPTGTLSGGECARLMLCKLILKGHNVLVLDEPTNHLDLESISALGESITDYKGTIFYVTHDRDLAARATRIFAFPEPNVLIDYQGSIDEYLDWYDKHHKKSA